MQKTLTLTIKKRWFDEILSGRKTEEYREIKKYYIDKFTNQQYDTIKLRAGYSKASPVLVAEIVSISAEIRRFDMFPVQCFVIKIKNAKLLQ